jgi:hypothetical protein
MTLNELAKKVPVLSAGLKWVRQVCAKEKQ